MQLVNGSLSGTGGRNPNVNGSQTLANGNGSIDNDFSQTTPPLTPPLTSNGTSLNDKTSNGVTSSVKMSNGFASIDINCAEPFMYQEDEKLAV